MKLVLRDTLATAYIVEPFRQGWVPTDLPVELREDIQSKDIGVRDFALCPSVEISCLADSHAAVPDVAVASEMSSLICLRCPVRLDEIDSTWVRMTVAGGTAEVLARALLWPFYGIKVEGWTTDPRPNAALTLIEGIGALDPVEAGRSEDLGRAWFVWTGLPLVSHVLVAPQGGRPGEISSVVDFVGRLLTVGQNRRKELTRALAARYGIERPAIAELLRDQRYSLDETGLESLRSLLYRGAGGTRYSAMESIPVMGEENPSQAEPEGF